MKCTMKKKKSRTVDGEKLVRSVNVHDNYSAAAARNCWKLETHIFPSMPATRSSHFCIQYATPTFSCPFPLFAISLPFLQHDESNALASLWFHFHVTGKTMMTKILQTRQFHVDTALLHSTPNRGKDNTEKTTKDNSDRNGDVHRRA